MASFRQPIAAFAGVKVLNTLDYMTGIDGLPSADVIKFLMEGDCSVVIRPSGTEPKMKAYVSVSAQDKAECEALEARIAADVENYFK